MAWLTILEGLISKAPQIVSIIQQIIGIIANHPQGVQAGADAVKAHLDTLKV